MYWFERLLSGEKKPAAKTKFGFALVIVMPVFLISCGSRPGRSRHAILHVDGRDVQVIARAKRHIDGAGAVVRARRGDVMHSLDAVDLLLQRRWSPPTRPPARSRRRSCW